MPNVAISYLHKDRDLEIATSVMNSLNTIKEADFNCKMVPLVKEGIIENADKVARIFDYSEYIIIVLTEESIKSSWVNQEIGYIFSLMRREGLNVIILFDDREHVDGFLSSRKFNLSQQFCLKDVGNEEISKQVTEYLLEIYRFPIKIHEIELYDPPTYHSKKDDFNECRLSLFLENMTQKVMEFGYLGFVTQNNITVGFSNFRGKSLGYIENIPIPFFETKIGRIPGNYQNKFFPHHIEKECTIHQYPLHRFEGSDIWDINFQIVDTDYDRTSILFGLYVYIRNYGTEFYQATINKKLLFVKRLEEGGKIMLQHDTLHEKILTQSN